MKLNILGFLTIPDIGFPMNDLDKGKKGFRTVIEASKTIGVGTTKLKQIKSIYKNQKQKLF